MLTNTQVKQASTKAKDYKISDEKGLYLLVTKSGAKYWRLKYYFAKKEKLLALGVYPDIKLKEARNMRDDARILLRDGIDPAAQKRAQKATAQIVAKNSFEAIGREWYETHIIPLSEGHRNRTLRILEKDLFPQIGSLPIIEVKPPILLKAIRKIEKRDALETSHRAKRIAGQIFRYAIASGRAEHDYSADIGDALKPQPPTNHYSAITEPGDIGQLLLAMETYRGSTTVQSALSLSPLVFTRPGEVRHMEWTELDWNKSIWEIPAGKMKMNSSHIVPLSKQAILILKEQHLLTGRSQYVFPNARSPKRAMSENAVRVALRTMGFDNDTMTAHGFRAMARTILDEELNFRTDIIEHQLAHTVKDPNGRAYNRTKHLKERHKIVQTWADYLDALKKQAKGEKVDLKKYVNK